MTNNVIPFAPRPSTEVTEPLPECAGDLLDLLIPPDSEGYAVMPSTGQYVGATTNALTWYRELRRFVNHGLTDEEELPTIEALRSVKNPPTATITVGHDEHGLILHVLVSYLDTGRIVGRHDWYGVDTDSDTYMGLAKALHSALSY